MEEMTVWGWQDCLLPTVLTTTKHQLTTEHTACELSLTSLGGSKLISECGWLYTLNVSVLVYIVEDFEWLSLSLDSFTVCLVYNYFFCFLLLQL